MNPVEQLITFVASISIILYFLLIGYYLRRIMIAVEKLSGVNKSNVIECTSCGKRINLGVGYREPYAICPMCKAKITVNQPEFLTPEQQKEEVFP